MNTILIKSALLAVVLSCAAGDRFELGAGARLIMKIYDECQRKGLGPCLKLKAINFFERASRSREIQIGEGLILVRKGDPAPEDAVTTEQDLEQNLPRGREEARDKRLNALLFRRVADFVNNHRLMVALPTLNPVDIQEGIEEGRGKMKKMMSMMMMGLGMKMAAVVPMAMGLLLLVAGKALIMAKLAFVLSLIMTLKKLLQKQSHGHDSGWNSGGGWDRSFQEGYTGAQEMAYRAYAGNSVADQGMH